MGRKCGSLSHRGGAGRMLSEQARNMNSPDEGVPVMRRNRSSLSLLVDGEMSDDESEEDRVEPKCTRDPRQCLMDKFCRSMQVLPADQEHLQCDPDFDGVAVSWKPTLSQRITHPLNSPTRTSPLASPPRTSPPRTNRTKTDAGGTLSFIDSCSPCPLRKDFSFDVQDFLSQGPPSQRRSFFNSDSPTRLKWPGRNEVEFARGKALLQTLTFDTTQHTLDDLCHLALEVFILLGVREDLGIAVEKLQSFILVVRTRMFDNPYHNFRHVVDVMQTSYALAHLLGTLSRLSPWEKFALAAAALCHDLEHPGVSSAFVSEAEELFTSSYKDLLLEKHHALRAFEVMVDREVDLLRGLRTVKYYEVRGNVNRVILATDISKHSEYLAKLRAHIAHSESARAAGGEAVKIDKHFEMELILKCADISNVVKPWATARRWAVRVTDEFFLQGDLERSRAMPVTPACDRLTQSRVPLQKGFIDGLCATWFETVTTAFPAFAPALNQMRANRAAWEVCSEEELEACRDWADEEDPFPKAEDESCHRLHRQLKVLRTKAVLEHDSVGIVRTVSDRDLLIDPDLRAPSTIPRTLSA
mmetsp:Transcript_14283/g.33037  ORF Transcript_14283/g.33037 Transcript_14283/m.33037 type:complete len:585 (-) Transcript_14283:192-1946(-)